MTVTVAAVAIVRPQAALWARVAGRLAVATPTATAAATPPPATSPAAVFATGGVAITRRVSLATAVAGFGSLDASLGTRFRRPGPRCSGRR
jgi:hypothetical protein